MFSYWTGLRSYRVCIVGLNMATSSSASVDTRHRRTVETDYTKRVEIVKMFLDSEYRDCVSKNLVANAMTTWYSSDGTPQTTTELKRRKNISLRRR